MKLARSLRNLIIAIEAISCFAFSLVPNNGLLLRNSARVTRRCFSFTCASKSLHSRLTGQAPILQSMNLDCADSAKKSGPENEVLKALQSSESSDRLADREIFPTDDDELIDLFESLPHDAICMVDSGLLIYYQNGFLPGWQEWVDEHYRLGRRLYMLDFAARFVMIVGAELGLKIPECFQVLKYQPKISEDKLQKVLRDVVLAMDVDCHVFDWGTGSLPLDLQGVAAAWYVFNHADPSQFSEADRASSGVVYMSSKANVFGEYLGTAAQRDTFETVIRDNGLGRLVPCRRIQYFRGYWKDLF